MCFHTEESKRTKDYFNYLAKKSHQSLHTISAVMTILLYTWILELIIVSPIEKHRQLRVRKQITEVKPN